jgi:hypothetical protein
MRLLSIAFRLAAGASRGERIRLALIVVGTAIGVGFLLCAATVLAIHARDPKICIPLPTHDGCEPVQAQYTSSLLDEPGLRPGVAIACLLLLIPVLVFLGQCSRIGAATRDRRLAALRLAGATPKQALRLAALDTGCASAVGAVAGLGLFAAVRAIAEAAGPGAPPRPLPTDVPLNWAAVTVIIVGIPFVASAAAAVALHQVSTSPLSVSRREHPGAPSPLPAVLVIAGPLAMLLPGALVRQGNGPVVLSLVLGVLLTSIGLLSAGSWLAALIGASVAAHSRHGALLIAGRRLAEHPWAEGRAMSAVVLCALFASGAEVLRTVTLAETDPDDHFYANAYQLVEIAILVALVVAAAGLVVAAGEAIVERRRSLAALAAAGVSRATLRRAVLAQAMLPVVPGILLAVGCGAASVALFNAPTDLAVGLPLMRLAVIAAIAIAVCLAASAATLPLLRTAAAPAELRYE